MAGQPSTDMEGGSSSPQRTTGYMHEPTDGRDPSLGMKVSPAEARRAGDSGDAVARVAGGASDPQRRSVLERSTPVAGPEGLAQRVSENQQTRMAQLQCVPNQYPTYLPAEYNQL